MLPNAVDPVEFQTPADGAAVRRTHGLGDAIVVGFVGWFVEWHRVELLIEACADLCHRHERLRVLLIAEGPLQSALAAQAEQLGIAGRVVFAGSVAHDAVPAHVAAMDICVVPHSNEYRSPIKLFEYMGQGRAVVAPRTEPIEMVVRDGENGLLFAPGSAPALAQAIERLVANPADRGRMGAQAREDVLGQHTWRHNAEAVLARVSDIG